MRQSKAHVRGESLEFAEKLGALSNWTLLLIPVLTFPKYKLGNDAGSYSTLK